MRIISGIYKGRRFTPPSGFQARPTTDFAKEGLFNLLDNRMNIAGSTALDLFSGTGSIGLELVSRGAHTVLCIEKSPLHARFIRQTAMCLGCRNLQVLQEDVFRFLQHASGSYSLIFADPPYALENLQEIPALIFQQGLLAPNGWLVVEHGGNLNFTTHPYIDEERQYGSVHFSFFCNTSK